ncbi:MAG: hypothetical protein AB7S26_08235 [Sandaracinaceae bacterium]
MQDPIVSADERPLAASAPWPAANDWSPAAIAARAAPPPPAGPLAIVESLLRTPSRLMNDPSPRSVGWRLALLLAACMVITGLVMASFSGGLQLLAVPLKLTVGVFFCAVMCLPSLHIFSSLAGAEQPLHKTWSALLMGVALIGVMLVGFAPVSFLFSQATDSVAFVGFLHVAFLLVASYFGLGLVRRALEAANGRPIRGTALFGILFVLVVLQMSTTLRPLVGEFEGAALMDKQFFLAHWLGEIFGRAGSWT